MQQTPNNPLSNRLVAGTSEAQVLEAVHRSGYPPQTFVAEILRGKLGVQEEWSFVDRDSDDLRALDIYTYTHLYGRKTKTRVRPQLDLLIECKQSDLPYMFFTMVGKTWLSDFPRIGGLRQHEIIITTNDDSSSWTFPIINALGLDSHPFQTAPPFCHTFSKCVRKGKDLELSGSDAYNGLVLPLTKAVQTISLQNGPVRLRFTSMLISSSALGFWIRLW
jgi:hypothetical protein